jgi:hypothetical protein
LPTVVLNPFFRMISPNWRPAIKLPPGEWKATPSIVAKNHQCIFFIWRRF